MEECPYGSLSRKKEMRLVQNAVCVCGGGGFRLARRTDVRAVASQGGDCQASSMLCEGVKPGVPEALMLLL